MALKQNTWTLNNWYDQDVAGNATYSGDGQLFVWGRGHVGELNNSSRVARSSPTQIPGSWYGANVLRRCGYGDYNHTTVVKNDGTLWMWGYNNYGALGQNDLTSYSSPVQVGTETTWSGGSPVNKATVVVKTDGTLWAWGFNWGGQLGQNEHDVYYSSPAQIPGTTWSQVGGGNCFTIAVKTNGELWSWGAPHNGKLGVNTNQSTSGGYSSPVQIPGTTWGKTELTLLQGGVNMCGSIKTDGTLWMWGVNERGQLGQNNKTNYDSPVQVPGTTWRSAVVGGTGSGAVIATKTDGTLWAWGMNHDGRCAQNNDPDNGGIDSYSSPIQIPGTDYTEMVGGAGGGLAVIKGEA